MLGAGSSVTDKLIRHSFLLFNCMDNIIIIHAVKIVGLRYFLPATTIFSTKYNFILFSYIIK